MAGARFLAVELDGRALLIDVRLIQEVIGPCDAMEVPHKSGELDGIFLWNGKAIPLVSLGNAAKSKQVGHFPSRLGHGKRRTLIFHALGEWAGLAVDDATDIVEFEPGQLLPVRHNPGPYITHEVDDGQAIRSVVDLTALVSRVLEVSAEREETGERVPSGAAGGGLPASSSQFGEAK